MGAPGRVRSRRRTFCRRGGTNVPRERARRGAVGPYHLTGWRSATTRPTDAGEPSRRRRFVGVESRPRRATDHFPRQRAFSRGDLAAASRYLRIHFGALLLGKTEIEGRSRPTDDQLLWADQRLRTSLSPCGSQREPELFA